MNRVELFKEVIQLMPSSYENEDGFRMHIDYLLYKYQSVLKLLDKEHQPYNWEIVIEQVCIISESIKNAIDQVYSGHPSSAYSILDSSINHWIAFWKTTKGTNWYRMRKMATIDYVTKEELFHIPLKKRGIVRTQRYSTPGYPCLYLGASIYGCWEELNRPDLNSCFISRIVNQKEMVLINMTKPLISHWKDKDQIISLDMECSNFQIYNITDDIFCSEIKRMPFVIASMVEVRQKDDSFKPEYIIPQLLMEIIINNGFWGVIYTSVHESNSFSFSFDRNDMFDIYTPRELVFLDNVAIPVRKPLANTFFCPELCSSFKLSDPLFCECDQAKSHYETSGMPHHINERVPYDSSIFFQLEKELSERELKTINSNV